MMEVNFCLSVPILENAFNLSPETFKDHYNADKPKLDQEVIFHCKMGGRAQKATEFAISLGYKK